MSLLLRQLSSSRRRAIQADTVMLGGRRIRPLPSQQEEAMKAGKELCWERSIFYPSVMATQLALSGAHLTKDQRRRSSSRLLRGL